MSTLLRLFLLGALLHFLPTASAQPPGKAEAITKAPLTRDRWNVAVVIHDQVELLDFAGPAEVFTRAAGGRAFRVYTVGETTRPVRSQGVVSLTPQYSVADCPKPDIVVIPGGETTVLLRSPAMMQWLRKTAVDAEIMFSVCTGVFVLADLGLLDGKEATTHRSSMYGLKTRPLIKARPDRRVVDNGKTVTAAGVSAGIDGALHVVARLCGPESAKRAARYMEFQWQPEPSASPSAAPTPETFAAHAWFAGDWKAAAKAYEEIATRTPHDAVAQYRLGWCQFRFKQFPEAAASLERAVQHGLRTGETYLALGFVTKKLKQTAQAAKHYEEALRLGLRDYDLYYDLSCCYAHLGDSTKALTALDQAFSEGFMSDVGSAQLEPDFDKLRGDARFGAIFRKYSHSHEVTITRANEPGERLVVAGVVRDADGRPVPGALVYAYHTDARGYYSADQPGQGDHPRLFAYLRTDYQGRYQYRTIRPASYPNSKVPQHVHYEVTAAGYRTYHGELHFDDDPNLTGRDREQAEQHRGVAKVKRDKDGVEHCTHDMTLVRE